MSILSPLQAAESLADPTEYENLFPGLREAFAAEHYLRETCIGSSRPAKDYPLVTVSPMAVGKCKKPCVLLCRAGNDLELGKMDANHGIKLSFFPF